MRNVIGPRCLYAPLRLSRTSHASTLRLLSTSSVCRRAAEAVAEDSLPPAKPKLVLSRTYFPQHSYAPEWYEYWKARGLLTETAVGGDPAKPKKEPVRMLLPPPNVTGELHIGHALMLSIQDALARFYRMSGHPVIWRPGTDHAGIATQTRVERHLNVKSRTAFGRTQLLDAITAWKDRYGGKILRQMESMGSSADPGLEYYTLSEELSSAVGRAFVKLHQQGLVYRSTRMVNWSMKAGTALSDIEVITNEVLPNTRLEGATFGMLHSVAFPVVGQSEREIVIATTRPETTFGDRAISVHPDDPRYADLHYEFVSHPLVPGLHIPIIPDANFVDREFGTGAVKITPAHDKNDFEFWKKHSSQAPPGVGGATRVPIPLVQVFGTDGKMLSIAPPELVGMDRLAVRNKVIDMFKAAGAYRGSQPIGMRIPQCSRTGCVIEPMLCPQWFLRSKPLAGKLMAAAAADHGEKKKDLLTITPHWYQDLWRTWLENIEDWCLSRQIWWGHKIPAWKVIDPEGSSSGKGPATDIMGADASERWIVALTEKEARAQLKEHEKHLELVQDEDVLDTWFSSGLLPLTTAGWTGLDHQAEDEWRKNYPLTFIESGSDILFFWLARMGMLCTWLSGGHLPFHELILHPLVCDATGRKMSKSLGNVLDPIAIIEGRSAEQVVVDVELESNSAVQQLLEIKSERESGNVTKDTSREIQRVNKDIEKNVKAASKILLEGIRESGPDALRMALLDYTRQTRSISFDVDHVEPYKKLITKLYNIFRYYQTLKEKSDVGGVEMEISTAFPDPEVKDRLQLHDLHMLYKLRTTIIECNKAFISRQPFYAVDALRKFMYDHFGNFYVMFIKPELDTGDKSREKLILKLTGFALDVLLRLAHPLMPFVTESIWQSLDPTRRQDVDGASIMTAKYPSPEDIFAIAEDEVSGMDAVVELIEVLRNTKEIRPKKLLDSGGWVKVVVVNGRSEAQVVKRYEAQIAKLAWLSKVLQVVPKEVLPREVNKWVDMSVTRVFSDETENGWWVFYRAGMKN